MLNMKLDIPFFAAALCGLPFGAWAGGGPLAQLQIPQWRGPGHHATANSGSTMQLDVSPSVPGSYRLVITNAEGAASLPLQILR